MPTAATRLPTRLPTRLTTRLPTRLTTRVTTRLTTLRHHTSHVSPIPPSRYLAHSPANRCVLVRASFSHTLRRPTLCAHSHFLVLFPLFSLTFFLLSSFFIFIEAYNFLLHSFLAHFLISSNYTCCFSNGRFCKFMTYCLFPTTYWILLV